MLLGPLPEPRGREPDDKELPGRAEADAEDVKGYRVELYELALEGMAVGLLHGKG